MLHLGRRWLLTLYFFLIITISGCWNNREIDRMSLTSAVGLDKADENKVELTLQIVKPSSVKNPGQPSGLEEPIWTYSITGDTVFEAFRNTYDVMDGRLFINQSQIMVIGEELAEDDLIGNLDFFERELEFSLKVQVLIAKGIKAKEVVNAKTELGNIPALHIMDVIKNNSQNTAKTKKMMLFDVIQDISRFGKQAVIPTIQYRDQKQEGELQVKDLKVEGTAIINNGKLTGYLDKRKTRGLLFVENKVKSTIINISNPQDAGKLIAIEVLRSKGKHDVILKNNQLTASIIINVQGNIGEHHGSGNFTSQEQVNQINKKVENKIKEEVESSLNEAQKNKADIFGFGEIVHKKYPKYWETIQNEWQEIFTNLPVQITVKSTIKRSGYIENSTKAQ